jgi:hypothetical protein
MYNRYLPKKPSSVKYNPELLNCIIVDIDGALAKKGDKDIYDYSKFDLDSVIDETREIIQAYSIYAAQCSPCSRKNSAGKFERYSLDFHIILISGRENSCEKETSDWLLDNYIEYDKLFMRNTGDKRDDYIVKKEIYEEHIKGKYNVKFVINDSKRVKRMWVNEGLFIFDVNQHDIEF